MSRAEVEVAIELRLVQDSDEFDHDPMRRVIRPAGTWERKNIGALAPPSPWEGLLA